VVITPLRGDDAEIVAFYDEVVAEPDEEGADIIEADTLIFDDSFWSRERVQIELGTDLENEIRAQVIPLLLEDFDLLYYELRSNIGALANTIHRRFDFDIWEKLEGIRKDIEIGGYYMAGTFITSFGMGITDFDEMLADGARMILRRLDTVSALMGNVLHMHLSSPADGDEANYRFHTYNNTFNVGIRYFPHPRYDRFVEVELTTSNSRNVKTRIIESGKIAYMSIGNADNSIDADRQQLLPFYEEIQNYEHLIIDISGHGGGYSGHFPETVMRLLIGEPVYVTTYLFFADGTYANRRLGSDPFSHSIETTGYFSVYDAREFVEERGMTEFNEDDLEYLAYAVELTYKIEPVEWGFPFNGKIWLLTGNRTSSGGEIAASEAMSSGFATVVGERTKGMSTADRLYIYLPNTDIVQPMDFGYLTDSLGRAHTEFGVIPDYFSRPGMNALNTVLAMIAEMDE
jgi:hypothetical protein